MKPTGAIIARLINGEMPYLLGSGGRLINRLMVAKADMGVLATTRFSRSDHPHFVFTPTICQTDAVAVFGVSAPHSEVLQGLTYEGSNPKRYSLIDVEARARDYISLVQIARTRGEQVASTHFRMRREGMNPALPGLYDRFVLKHLASR